METFKAFDIIETPLEASEEIYHALKMLEHSSIVQRSMPQCEFHPSTQHIELHIQTRISSSLTSGPLHQARKLLVALTRLCTSYDRPMLPQVRTFVLKFLIQTLEGIPIDRKTSEKDIHEKDRELLCKVYLQELLVSLDFRLLTLWCEIVKYWRKLILFVEYKAVRELLPLLFEQAGKMPVNLELATVPVKQAVKDYNEVMRFVIDRQHAFIPSLLVIDQMKRTFAATLPALSTNMDGLRRRFNARDSPPAYKHASQQKFVNEYVTTFQPLELILKFNEHVKNIMLPVLGLSPVKSWVIEPTTLRFADRSLWADLVAGQNAERQQIDFLVRLTLMPNSRDSIMHFITPLLPDLSPEKQSPIKPETLPLEHCLNDVFVCAVMQTMRFCASVESSNTDGLQQDRRWTIMARTSLLWKQLSQDLVHRYQLNLINSSEVITQLVSEVKHLRPAARGAAIDSFLFLVFDYFTCTQNVKHKPPRDDVFDLLRLFMFLYSGSSDQYNIANISQYFQTAGAVNRMAPASLWNYLCSVVTNEARPYVMSHRPPALLPHFDYLDMWRNGTLPAKTVAADNGSSNESEKQSDIEYAAATNAFSNDEEVFGMIGQHFLDQLLPAGHAHITKTSQQQQASRKNVADASTTPLINQSTTFGTKMYDYTRPLSWSTIDMMTIISRSKLSQALKMSYMKFHSTTHQALNATVSAASNTKPTNLLAPPQQQQQQQQRPSATNADGTPAPPLSIASVQILLNVIWMSPACIETYAKFLFNNFNEIHSLFGRAQKNILHVIMPQQLQNPHAYHHFQAGFLISFSPVIELYSVRNFVPSTSAETLRALQSLLHFQSETYFLVAYNPAVAINTWRVIVQTLTQGFDLLDLEANVLTSKSSRLTDFDFITDRNEEIAKLFILLLAQASHITGRENTRITQIKHQLVRLAQASSSAGDGTSSSVLTAMPWHMVLCMPEYMQRVLADLNLLQPATAPSSNAYNAILFEVERTATNVQSILSTAVATASETLEAARIVKITEYFMQPQSSVVSTDAGGSSTKNQMPPSTLYAYLFSLLHTAVLSSQTKASSNVDAVWGSAFHTLGGLNSVARIVDGLRLRRRSPANDPPPVATTLHYDNIRTLAYYVMATLPTTTTSSSLPAAAESAEFTALVQTLSMLIFNMGLFTLDAFLMTLLLTPSDRSSGLAPLLDAHRLAVKLANSQEYIAYLVAAVSEIKVPSPGEWLPSIVAGNNIGSCEDGDYAKSSLCEANLRLTERYPEMVYFSGQVRSLRRFDGVTTKADAWCQSINFSSLANNGNGQPIVHYVMPPQYFMNLVTAMVPCVELLMQSLLSLLSVSLSASSGSIDVTNSTESVFETIEQFLTSPAMWTVSAYHPKPLTLLSNTMRYFKSALLAQPNSLPHIEQRLAQLRRLLCRSILLPFCSLDSNNWRGETIILPLDVCDRALRAAFRRNIVPNFTPHFATYLLASDMRSKEESAKAGASHTLNGEFMCDNLLRDYGISMPNLDAAKSGTGDFVGQNVPALLAGDHDECRAYVDQILADLCGALYNYYTYFTPSSTSPDSAAAAANRTLPALKTVKIEETDDIMLLDSNTNEPVSHGSSNTTKITDQSGQLNVATTRSYLNEHCNACIDYRYSEITNPSKRILLCAILELAVLQLDRFVSVPIMLGLPERIEIAYYYADYENNSTEPSSALVRKFGFLQQLVERRHRRLAEQRTGQPADTTVDAANSSAEMRKQFDAHEIEAVNQLKLNNLKLMNCIAILLSNMPTSYLDVFYDQIASVIETFSPPRTHLLLPDGSAVACTGVNCDIFERLRISSIFSSPAKSASVGEVPVEQQQPIMTFSSDKYRPALALHLFRNVCMHLNTSRLNAFMRLCISNPDAVVEQLPGSSFGGGSDDGRWAARVDTEEKLIFMLHCFGPLLDRLKYESHSTTHRIRYATLQMLAQVDRNLATAASTAADSTVRAAQQLFHHAHTISDFFYILKYLYTGDARLADSDKLAADLHCPAMKLQLRFLVAPDHSNGANAAATVASTAVDCRSETPQASNLDAQVALSASLQQETENIPRNTQADNLASPNGMQTDMQMGK